MSTIQTNAIVDAAGGNTATVNGISPLANSARFARNLIINGGMQVWQRATSATAVTNSSYGTVDRFRFWENTDGAYTAEQSTDVPSGQGFSYSTKLQVTTADTSLTAAQYAQFAQRIEAQNLQQLCYGTSEAKTVTVSFWVKSSKTGNYAFNMYKPAAGHTAYIYYKSFTINTANTWEKKTITVSPTAGSTSFITASGGGIDTSTSNAMEVYFTLSMGSTYQGATDNSWSTNTSHYTTSSNVNWLDSTSNNFYLTGVQLEVGDTATDFEHRTYAEELAACQRYYYRTAPANTYSWFAWGGYSNTTTNAIVFLQIPERMRAAPTLGYGGNFQLADGHGVYTCTNPSLADPTQENIRIDWTSSGLTVGRTAAVRNNNDATAFLEFSAEI